MKKATLVAGNLVCGFSQPAPATFEDLLDCLLFAQLVADEQASRFAAPERWFAEHDKALRMLKWHGSDFRRDTFPPMATSTYSIAELVKQALLDRIPSAQADNVTSVMACMAGLPETGKEQLLFRKSVLALSPDGVNEPSVPAPVHTIALQLTVLAVQKADPASLFLTFKTTDELSHDIFHQPFAGASMMGPVEMRFQQHQWSPAQYLVLRSRVRDFLAGKESGLKLPVCCDA
ncbi:hypothetical protein [Pseudomonas cichorii]|nr:hypothetical protein [Pseudomonas cichorii]